MVFLFRWEIIQENRIAFSNCTPNGLLVFYAAHLHLYMIFIRNRGNFITQIIGISPMQFQNLQRRKCPPIEIDHRNHCKTQDDRLNQEHYNINSEEFIQESKLPGNGQREKYFYEIYHEKRQHLQCHNAGLALHSDLKRM